MAHGASHAILAGRLVRRQCLIRVSNCTPCACRCSRSHPEVDRIWGVQGIYHGSIKGSYSIYSRMHVDCSAASYFPILEESVDLLCVWHGRRAQAACLGPLGKTAEPAGPDGSILISGSKSHIRIVEVQPKFLDGIHHNGSLSIIGLGSLVRKELAHRPYSVGPPSYMSRDVRVLSWVMSPRLSFVRHALDVI